MGAKDASDFRRPATSPASEMTPRGVRSFYRRVR